MSARRALLTELSGIAGVVIRSADEWAELSTTSLRPLKIWVPHTSATNVLASLVTHDLVCVDDDGEKRQLWASVSEDGVMLVDVCHTFWLVADTYPVLHSDDVTFPHGNPSGPVVVALFWEALHQSPFPPDDLWEAANEAWDRMLVHERDAMLAPFSSLCRTLLESAVSSSDVRIAQRAHRALKRASRKTLRLALVRRGAHRTAAFHKLSPIGSLAVALPSRCEELALEAAALLTAAGVPAHPVDLGGTVLRARIRYLTRVLPLRLSGAVAVCHGWPLTRYALPRPAVVATSPVVLLGHSDSELSHLSRQAASEAVWIAQRRASRTLIDASVRVVAAASAAALERRFPRTWSGLAR